MMSDPHRLLTQKLCRLIVENSTLILSNRNILLAEANQKIEQANQELTGANQKAQKRIQIGSIILIGTLLGALGVIASRLGRTQ
jgi:hypothetical protein